MWGGPGLWREPVPVHGGDGEKQIVWCLLGSWLHCGSWASALTQRGEVFLKIPSVLTGTDPPFVSCSPPEPSVCHHLQRGRWVGDQHRPRQVCELDVHAQWEHAWSSLLHILGFLLAVSFRVCAFPSLLPHCLIWNWVINCSETEWLLWI